MSNFSYPPPPPPPPPPPDSYQTPYASAQHDQRAGGQRIQTFQSQNDGRGRRPDGRGAHYGGNRGMHNRPHIRAHNSLPSGGQSVMPNQASNPTYPATMSHGHNPQQGYYGVGQQYSQSAPWSAPQQHYGNSAVAPSASLPYGNHYPVPMPLNSAPQGYPHVPAHHPGYPQPAGYAPPSNPVYQSASYPYAPPPPPPPTTSTAHSRPSFEDRRGGGPRQSHNNNRSEHGGGRNDHGLGQKRKREQSPHRAPGRPNQTNPSSRGGRSHDNNSRGGGNSHSIRPKVLTAPSVPSFGFHALPPRPPSTTAQSNAGSVSKDRKKQKKRKTNQLGLTPKGDVHDVTDEEKDEEAAYIASGAPATIEFRGRTVSVSTAAEIRNWIAERKKKFPTASRIAEKKAQREVRQREAEEKRKQRNEEQSKAQLQKKNDQKVSKKAKKNKGKKDVKVKEDDGPVLSKEEQQRKKLERHLRKAEKLRSMLEQSDIKDGSPSGTKPEVEDDALSSESDSSSDSSSSDSDAAPDVEPTRGRGKPVHVPAGDRKGANDGATKSFTNMPCKYFMRDGHCRRKHCRFLHSLPATNEKKTLFERLKDQQDHEESMQTLEIIKQLGERGFFEPDQ